ncbi:hypothetical protein ID866_4462, partial [Astraeus odoratus]
MHSAYWTKAAAIRSIHYHGAASFTLMVWNHLSTLEDEIRFIWPMRNGYILKWLYIFLRYFLLFMQMVTWDGAANFDVMM